MYYIIEGHNFIYDIQTISQIFFANEKFTKVESPSSIGFTIVSSLTDTKCIGELYKNGILLESRVSLRHRRQSETDLLQEIRRELTTTLYLALQAYTAIEPPWGALTGIRPSKMARLIMEESGLDSETAVDLMQKNYMARKDKIQLAVDVALAEKEILRRQPPDAVSIYVGIPFCPSRCLYCSFASYEIDGRVDSYLTALYKELLAIKNLINSKHISSIYIGGGTPTSLSKNQLDNLCSKVIGIFGEPDEFCVEAGRPDTLDILKLEILKKYHVTRISINPQTMNDGTLARIGRNHSSKDIEKCFIQARSIGFDNINTDIILGLPGETSADTQNTLEKITALRPENITVHMLTIKRGSRLIDSLQNFSPSGPLELETMLTVSQTLCAENNYSPYYIYRQKNTIGNFENVGYTLPGKACVYNVIIMEETQTIWAAGAGAVTKLINGDKISRVFNVKSLNDYINRIDEMIKRKEDSAC
ncbi:MAG: coproporphyrinogen dehydrogenase HemZ [Clostridiales bacterium]|jgi:oxygen-independent coproporphyrinogen-3 oxidase|nr:coproporphyrinogen dehydrogenase HemZ [Clostridiales bacterium]